VFFGALGTSFLRDTKAFHHEEHEGHEGEQKEKILLSKYLWFILSSVFCLSSCSSVPYKLRFLRDYKFFNHEEHEGHEGEPKQYTFVKKIYLNLYI